MFFLNERFVIFGQVTDAILRRVLHCLPHFLPSQAKKIRERAVEELPSSHTLFHFFIQDLRNDTLSNGSICYVKQEKKEQHRGH
jgi:hypothetical protein